MTTQRDRERCLWGYLASHLEDYDEVLAYIGRDVEGMTETEADRWSAALSKVMSICRDKATPRRNNTPRRTPPPNRGEQT